MNHLTQLLDLQTLGAHFGNQLVDWMRLVLVQLFLGRNRCGQGEQEGEQGPETCQHLLGYLTKGIQNFLVRRHCAQTQGGSSWDDH